MESRGGEGAPSSPLGAVIDKRPAPEASCPPAAQAKKALDLQDPKSASVSAQDARKVRIHSIRKRKRADETSYPFQPRASGIFSFARTIKREKINKIYKINSVGESVGVVISWENSGRFCPGWKGVPAAGRRNPCPDRTGAGAAVKFRGGGRKPFPLTLSEKRGENRPSFAPFLHTRPQGRVRRKRHPGTPPRKIRAASFSTGACGRGRLWKTRGGRRSSAA